MGYAPDGKNLLLGRGKVYFDRWVNGVTSGREEFQGNIEAVEFGGNVENREKYSSCEATGVLLASVPVKSSAECTVTLTEHTVKQLALFCCGDVSAYTQSVATNVAKTFTGVALDAYYKTAYLNASAITCQKAPSTALDAGIDFDADLQTGRVYLRPGAVKIAAGDDLIATTSAPAITGNTMPTVRAGNSTILGTMRFIGAPANGPTLMVEVWKVRVTPDGSLNLISDDFGNFKLKMTIFADLVSHGTEPFYRITQLAAGA